jgi:hypothetical protein
MGDRKELGTSLKENNQKLELISHGEIPSTENNFTVYQFDIQYDEKGFPTITAEVWIERLPDYYNSYHVFTPEFSTYDSGVALSSALAEEIAKGYVKKYETNQLLTSLADQISLRKKKRG